MARRVLYDSKGNEIICWKEYDALAYPCDGCDKLDCLERETYGEISEG